MEVGPVIADLKSCREKVVLRRKAVKDTCKQWFVAEIVASLAVGEVTPRTTFRISDAVEVGEVQFVEEHKKTWSSLLQSIFVKSWKKKEEASASESCCGKKAILC